MKMLLVLSLFLTAGSAHAINADLVKRFDILQNVSTKTDQLFYKNEIGKDLASAKAYAEAIEFVKEQKWNSAYSDLCFDAADSTYSINLCAENQVLLVEGTIGAKFQDLKRTVRGSEFLAKDLTTTDAVKFVQDAAIAQGKIVEGLCDISSLSWWGGTGRTATYLGCQSKFLEDVKDFDILAALASYKDVVVPADADPLDFMTQANWTVYEAREKIKATVDSGNTTFDEDYLSDADKALNEAYAATQKYFQDTYSDPSTYVNVDGKVLSVYAIAQLKKVETTWIHYRDGYCQAYSVYMFPNAKEQADYGPLARVQCLTRLSSKQTDLLKSVDRE